MHGRRWSIRRSISSDIGTFNETDTQIPTDAAVHVARFSPALLSTDFAHIGDDAVTTRSFKRKKPANEAGIFYGGISDGCLVAGAGFEPATFRL